MTMSSDNFQQISYSLLLALSCSSFVQVSRPRVRRDSADNPDGPVQHLPSAKHHVSVLPFEYSNFEHSFRQNTNSMDSRMFMNPTKCRFYFYKICENCIYPSPTPTAVESSKRTDGLAGFPASLSKPVPLFRKCAQGASLFTRESALRAVCEVEPSRRQMNAGEVPPSYGFGNRHHTVHRVEPSWFKARKLNRHCAVVCAHRLVWF